MKQRHIVLTVILFVVEHLARGLSVLLGLILKIWFVPAWPVKRLKRALDEWIKNLPP